MFIRYRFSFPQVTKEEKALGKRPYGRLCEVDAPDFQSAAILAQAWMLAHGHRHKRFAGSKRGFSPAHISMPRVVPLSEINNLERKERGDEWQAPPCAWQAPTFEAFYGSPPCADFAKAEQRIAAHMGLAFVTDPHQERADKDGVTRAEGKRRNYMDIYGGIVSGEEYARWVRELPEGYAARRAQYDDGRGWVNMYRSLVRAGDGEGEAFAGGGCVYASKFDAQYVADKHGNGGRNNPTLITWPVKRKPPVPATAERIVEDAAKSVGEAVHKYAETYHATKTVVESTWVGTDGVARTVTGRTITPETFAAGVAEQSAPPPYWHQMTSGQQRHFENRLKQWARLHDVAQGVKLFISSSDDNHFILISAGSSRWEAVMNRLRAYLTELGVPYGKHNRSMIRVRWGDIAPYLWPL